MATKYYGIRDNWTDDDVANVIEVESEDGSVSSVKVNGEEYGGGGGDFSTAEVTIINNSNTEYRVYASTASYYPRTGLYVSEAINEAHGEDSTTLEVILYKGTAYGLIKDYNGGTPTASSTGGVLIDGEDLTITGDGTITIS